MLLNMGGVIKAGPLPEGLYAFTVDDVEVRETKGKAGNFNLQVTLRVTESPEEDMYAGRKYTHFQSLHENSLPFVKAFLEPLRMRNGVQMEWILILLLLSDCRQRA